MLEHYRGAPAAVNDVPMERWTEDEVFAHVQYMRDFAARLDQPGDVSTVLRVLHLVFNEGYSGDVDLAAETIRLTRQLAAVIDHEEVAGLMALMLLHHARRAARTRFDESSCRSPSRTAASGTLG